MEYSIEQALERQTTVAEEIRRVGSKTEEQFTDEDGTYLEGLESEFTELDRHIRTKKREALVARVDPFTGVPVTSESGHTTRDLDDDPIREPGAASDPSVFSNPWDTGGMNRAFSNAYELGDEYKARAFSAIERMTGTNDDRRAVMTRFIEDFDTPDGKIAQNLLATSSPAYLRAFTKVWLRGQDVGTLAPPEQEAWNRAMSTTTTAGGFLIPQQLDPSVILTSDGSFNQARAHFRQVVATGNVWNGVSTTEATWSVDAEAAEVSDDATTFANPQVTLYKLAGFIPISIEALQDEANVTTEIGRILAMGKDSLESQLFITGTGSSQHTGVVTGVDAVTASRVASTTADTFGLEDVYLMDRALPARYRAGAGWFSHRFTQNLMRQFDTAGGAGLWADNLREDVPPRLLDRPAYEAEAMASVITGAADNLLLLYAHSDSFVIADRIGMTVEPIQHLFSNTTTRPSGQRGFYAYARSGSNVVNVGAARILRV
jgi:HK97 family phage major capsid protein